MKHCWAEKTSPTPRLIYRHQTPCLTGYIYVNFLPPSILHRSLASFSARKFFSRESLVKKKLLSCLLFLILIIPYVNSARAVDIEYIPQASVGYMAYTLRLPSTQLSDGRVLTHDAYNMNFKVFGLGMTLVAQDKFFWNIYAQTSDKSEDLKKDNYININSSSSASRTDLNTSLGMRVYKGLRIFGGYKRGETKLDDINYFIVKETGAFLGIANGFNLGKRRVIGFNLIYGAMNGKFSAFLPTNSEDYYIDYRPDIKAINTGISWNSVIRGKWAYSISADFHYYEIDRANTNLQSSPKQELYLLRFSLRKTYGD